MTEGNKMKLKVWSIEIDEIQSGELSTLVADLGRMLGARTLPPPTLTPAPMAQLTAHEEAVAVATGNDTPTRKPARKPGRKPGPKPKKGQDMQTDNDRGHL